MSSKEIPNQMLPEREHVLGRSKAELGLALIHHFLANLHSLSPCLSDSPSKRVELPKRTRLASSVNYSVQLAIAGHFLSMGKTFLNIRE